MDRNRWTRGAARAGAVVALLACLVGKGQAAPAGQAAPDGKIYTNQPVFNLPIKLDERSRPAVRDVTLFVKFSSGPWVRAEVAKPTQTQFRYQAMQDGEYWFSVVTTDHAGQSTPRDVNREAPALMVVVDTQPPACELQAVPQPVGGPALRCVVQDANPDYQAIKVSYRAADQMERMLESVAGQPGLFRAPGPEALGSMVRVQLEDRAHNKAVREFDLKEVLTRAGLTQASAAGSTPPTPAVLAPLPATPVQGVTSAPRPNSEIIQAGGVQPYVAAKQAPLPNAPAAEAGLPTPRTLPESVGTQVSAPVQAPAQAPGSPRQIINTTHASIDYRIDPVGPSGIGRVEVWMSPDKGTNWRKLGEDVDRRSPAEVDLPGEGVYGIRLVVTNGNGFGGKAPAPGDAPMSWVEVDITKPVVQLHNIDPTTSGGTLEIRWVVTDKNLGAEPINLFYAARREGPWLPIARNVKNDGSHRWTFPRDVGGQFYVKLEATDLAGNTTACETPQPVTLDMTEPNALVVGITGMGNAPARGN